jgi:transcriptional regulator GlxA family with amidase domain
MPNPTRVIAFLVAAPVDLLNLVGLISVFSHPKVEDRPAYLTTILSVDRGAEVRGTCGIAVRNIVPFSEYKGPIDTLVIVSAEHPISKPPADLVEWILRRAGQVRRIASVCTGTFMLAGTGLLDGKRVTTHWQYADRLAKGYPRLKVEREPIFVKDGNVYTTAGATAGIDMALALVEEDLGSATATSIARELILYLRRSGEESQYSALLAQQAEASGTRLSDLPAWTRRNLARRLNVSALAKAVAMTPRTFARQFEAHFQTTPARWVQSLRVEVACVHLEGQNLPLKSIARLTGFRNEQSLRRAFLQQLSMTPREYRERCGAFRVKE